MGNDITCHVGLDTSKSKTVGYGVFKDGGEDISFEVATVRSEIRRMVRRLSRKAGRPLSFCYEAGPCGYELQRWIRAEGAECVVVAPAFLPGKAGERIKTNRRDAKKLAMGHRAGLLTQVYPRPQRKKQPGIWSVAGRICSETSGDAASESRACCFGGA